MITDLITFIISKIFFYYLFYYVFLQKTYLYILTKIFNKKYNINMKIPEIKIPQITWFNNGEKTNEELDNLSLQRFNIKNIKSIDSYKDLKNFYAFKVLDLDEKSETGYYAMCINKEYAKMVQESLNKLKTNKK